MRKAISMASILILLVAFAGGMGGCASTPLVKPETVPQKLVYAYGLIEGVAGTVEMLYRTNLLSEKETRDSANSLQKAWEALDSAQALYYAGKDKDYQMDLSTALEIVDALRGFLMERSRQ